MGLLSLAYLHFWRTSNGLQYYINQLSCPKYVVSIFS
jgi:hypothetical protein